jgi:DNA-directed RNA polymerase specialized sigma24 family protein
MGSKLVAIKDSLAIMSTEARLSRRYTPEVIRRWIEDWPYFFESSDAERSLAWTEIKADILQVVEDMSDRHQDIFILVGMEQCEFPDAARIMKIGLASAYRYWDQLIQEVTWKLRNQRIYPQEFTGKGPYPAGWAGGKIDWYDRS